MTKKQFLNELKLALGNDVEQQDILKYYEELIDEAVLDGESEEEMIKRLGSVKEIIQTMGKTYPANLTKKRESVTLFKQVLLMIVSVIALFFFISLISSGGISFFTTLLRVGQYESLYLDLYFLSEALIAVGVIFISSACIYFTLRRIKQLMTYFEERRSRL
ncbi:MAG: DUF1700 domain-containing protein [Paracholeplasma sp.]|nr:DUF1700 domain-containing protein [Paracholeplasma sp.]MDY3195835.1 DUF1700 domain-containing protein [Paracholeplasma sp.]